MDCYKILLFVVLIVNFTCIHNVNSSFCVYTRAVKTTTRTRKSTADIWGIRRSYWKYKNKYQTKRYQACCDGWEGEDCDIPICEQGCGDNGVCAAPNDCYCANGLPGACELQECDDLLDCFPGTCRTDRDVDACQCASSFGGANCRRMVYGGEFAHCFLDIYANAAGEAEPVLHTQCVTSPFEPPAVKYTNRLDVIHIALDWETTYDPVQPRRPYYIIAHQAGFFQTYVHLAAYDEDSVNIFNLTEPCDQIASTVTPPASMVCDISTVHWPIQHPVQHRWTLHATFVAETGGYKRLTDPATEVVGDKSYHGTTISEEITIKFDSMPAQHCTFIDNCTLQEYPAVNLPFDITQESEVYFASYGWWDEDSGVNQYSYKLYSMAVNNEGVLEEHSEALHELIVLAGVEDTPSMFQLPQPGMYSIVLTVEDNVHNEVKARALVLYDDTTNGVTIDDDVTVDVTGAEVTELGYWVSSRTDSFTINWDGKLRNRFHEDNSLLATVARRDDVREEVDDTIGNRTLDRIDNAHGIVKFEVGWASDVTTEPSIWYDVEDVMSQQYVYDAVREDGQTIVFYIRGYDVFGAMQTHNIEIYTDESVPTIDPDVSPRFTPQPDSFQSSIQFRTSDTQSGIRDVTFSLHVNEVSRRRRRRDTGQRRLVHSTTQSGGVAADRTAGDCAVIDMDSDQACYCIPQGTCYTYTQQLHIDNCWLRDERGAAVVVEYTVHNSAGLPASSTFNIGVVQPGNFHGVAYYPPPRDITVAQDGTQARVTWILHVTCYRILHISFSVDMGNREILTDLPANATSYLITDLTPDTPYPIRIRVHYEGGIRSDAGSPDTPFMSEQYGSGITDNKDKDEGLFTLTNIIGMAVGGAMLLVIVALVITMIVRKRQEKPVVPEVVRRTAGNVRDRISRYTSRLSTFGGTRSSLRRPGHRPGQGRKVTFSGKTETLYIEDENGPPGSTKLNVEYMRKSGYLDDDIFAYGISDPVNIEKWTKSEDCIRIGKPLPKVKSRFADLCMATLKTDQGRIDVVAKMCKPNANEMERILMRSKMNFMGEKCPKHLHVLDMVGAVTTHPILLFEHCDVGRLYDWLVGMETVTAVQEDMFVQFSMQICKAMEVLHDNEIIHKRLCTRNVLLKSTADGKIIVKVAGFGPMKGEESKDQIFLKKSSKDKVKKETEKSEMVPLKWLAPEQLDTDQLGRRQYDEQTDAWAFAVTLWEIFSKGAMPYGKRTNAEMYEAVKGGYRLEKPQYCSPFMYDEIIKPCWEKNESRRSFARMYEDMNHFFNTDLDDVMSGDRSSAFVYDPDQGIFSG